MNLYTTGRAILFSWMLVLLTSTTVSAQIPRDGLISHHSFDSTYYDSIRTSASTQTTDVTFIRDRCFRPAKAIRTNGTTSVVDFGKFDEFNTNLKNFSISFWFKSFPNKNDWESIVKTINNGNATVFSVEINRGRSGYESGYLGTFLRDQNGRDLSLVSINPSINDGEWHLFTAVVEDASQNRAKMYLDGKVQTLEPGFSRNSPSSFASFDHSLVLGAGMNRGTLERHFQGALDQLLIYDRSLTDLEVWEIFDQPCVVCSSDTIAIHDTVQKTDTIQIVTTDTVFINTCDTLKVALNDDSCSSMVSQVKLFPNPTKKELNLQFSRTTCLDNLEVTLWNAIGQKIADVELSGYQGAIEIDGLASGTYFIRILNVKTSAKFVLPFVKQ